MKYLILFCLFSINSFSQRLAQDTISLGPVKIGENRLPLSPKNFVIVFEKRPLKFEVKFEKESLQWVRTESNLLLPRMKLHFLLLSNSYEEYSLRYDQKSFFFQFTKEGAIVHVNYALFESSPIEIFKNGKLINKVTVRPKPNKELTGLIDYSCTKYNLKIDLPREKFYSVGCIESISGGFGEQRKTIEVTWISPGLKLRNGDKPPFVSTFIESGEVSSLVVDEKGNEHRVKMTTKFHERYHRLRTAVGFGPHILYTSEGNNNTEDEITSPLYIYGRFDLNLNSSFRFFNGVVMKDSVFNNGGLYFAYDLGKAFDERIIVTALLGLQFVYHKHDGGKAETEGLFPQGVELTYKHAFGQKDYSLIYGFFFTPNSDDEYTNTWIRYGKRIFWEVNYMSWKQSDRYAKTWGLSVGLPLAQFF